MTKHDHEVFQTALNEALRNDFGSFARKTFSTVSTDAPFKPNWHWDAIAHALTECVEGKTRRLLITLPPRSGKSILGSVALPAYVLGRDPTQKIICASYAGHLSTKYSRDTRIVMLSPWYRRAFKTRLSPEKNTEDEFMTTARGFRLSTSVGGVVTGRGGNFIIIDDPMKPDEAFSEAGRAKVVNWFDGTLMSRFDDKTTGVVIVIMQRLHVEDLAGHLIDKGGWTHLNLPAIAPTESTHFIGPNVPYRRTAGEPLHAAREPLETLAQIKRDLGELIFSAQYQQEPIPPEGEFVKMAWFQRYAEAPVRRDSDRVVQSWDTAMSESPGSDYSVCTTWLVRDQHFYLLDVLRERLDFPALKKRAIAHYREWRAQTMLIEDKGSGQSLVQDLRADAKAPPPIPVKVVSDKQSRMAAVTAMIEAGHVFIPEQASWLEAFRAELLQFPNGRYDDQADSLSQFLTWQRRQQRGYGDAAASVGSILIVGGHACGEPDPDEIDLYARDDFGGDS